MALRVGIDSVAVDSVTRSVAEFGDRYLNRVYTAAECSDCDHCGSPRADRLAARFAAKEAAIKVLRPVDEPIPWRGIEVRRHPGGWCDLVLTGRAKSLADRAGVRHLALSMTHEEGWATAVVVAQIDEEPVS